MHLFRNVPALSLTIFLFLAAGSAQAQSARSVAQTARVLSAVEPGQTTRLQGHVPSWATAANDLGAVSTSRHLDNLHLVLTRAPEVQAAFDQLLADQQNPASPRYHQWLTPQQNAEQYGIAPADVSAVTDWLQSQGLSVDNVAAGGVFITFSGPVSVVENAFSTTLHNFSHQNTSRYAPTAEPAIPAALAGVIQSVAGLAEHVAFVHSSKALADTSAQPLAGVAQPLYNSGSSSHYVSPGDFDAIYNINATYNTGINGSGNRVVNLIDSRIAAADITGFNTVFGLNVAQPNQILLPGSTDPGLSADSEGEAALDVQRILGTAPGAAVDLLVFSDLGFNNIFSALQYEVGTLNDPIVNMSFGACNSGNSTSESTSFDSYFKTGAAQGISFFVSSGDNAAAGCDGDYTTIPAKQVLSTNLICASTYATCVGGTEFAEGTGSYWSGTNSSTRVSATDYIPEGAWDEPTYVSSGKTTYQATGTGGGITNFPKPSWQAGTGVPADGLRDVPDVSFTASYHDGYLICQADVGNDCSAGTFKYIVYGTSASSPSMAGIAALLDEKLGARQGNLNPLFYKLAATTTNGVFHDVTIASSGVSSCSTATPSMCNNSTPAAAALTGGLTGYAVTTGYDLVTGLGSLDVTNFLTAASFTTTPAPVATTLALTASANPISTTQTVSFTARLSPSTSSSTPTGTVQFYSNGTALGSAVTLSADAATTPALTFSTPGTYAITAIYSGDTNFTTSTAAALSLVVTGPSSFTVTPATTSIALDAGATTTEAITVASVNSFIGTVSLGCTVTTASGTASGTCSLAPSALTLGSTAASVLTINTAAGTSGILNVSVTGTSGATAVSASVIQVTVALPSFTVASTPSSLSVVAGSTSGNTEKIILTSVNGFTGTIGLTCAVTPATSTSAPTCTLAPLSVTLAAGGTATTVVTIATSTQTASLHNSLRRGGAMFAVLLCLLPFRRRKAIRSLMALLLFFAGISAISGCGSGGSLSTAATSAATSYTVTVTGTGTAAGSSAASTASTAFTLSVN